jgi:hypothetical protein
LLLQIPVPENFVGLEYRELFEHMLCARGGVCLGLYRTHTEFLRGNTSPYVFTNPPVDTLLKEGDFLYVLMKPKVCLFQGTVSEHSGNIPVTLSEHCGNASPSIFTNPPVDTLLKEVDLLYELTKPKACLFQEIT